MCLPRKDIVASTLTPAFLVASLLIVPTLASRAQARTVRMPSPLEQTVDASLRPGDDFFAYANGSWLKATQIPAGKERWAARNEIDATNRRRVAQLLDDAAKAPRGSDARKIADFRGAYLDDAAITRRGIAPLTPLLDSIDRIHDKATLTQALGRSVRADVDPLNVGIYRSATLLGLSVEESIHGEKTNVAFLVQGGLGLPDREHYLSADPRMQTLRSTYCAYIARLFTLAAFDHADQRADAVLALETAIARTQGTREASANDRNADSVWTRTDFAREAPGLDWSAFFSAAGMSRQHTFVAWQPSAVRGVASLVASEPLQSWKDYLRFHALDTDADVLPGEFANEALAVHRAAANDKTPQAVPRTQRADNATQLAMSDAIGHLYAERYFPAEQKARVNRIVANVVAAFAQRVQASTWMSPASKAIALKKVHTLYVGVGYPEHWDDFADLEIDPTDAVGNARRVAERNYRHALALLDTPVDMTKWWIAPQAVGGILIFQQNAYDFAAALLQPPKFDAAASDAATYGAIGAVIGHDVVHYVDVLGADYDTTGAMHHWWSPDDMQRFQGAAAPLVQQFSGYRPFPDVAINGTLTLTENVADLGGLSAAFDAYRASLGGQAADRDFVRASDREFFIAFAQSWRTKISDSAMRTQAASNDHAPEMYRISTVRNMDAWYDAFDVRPGDKLYVAPAARVRIW